MYKLKTEASFDSAHFLKDYEGKCRNIHGHRWRVIAEIKGNELKPDGQMRDMLTDFGNIKADLKTEADYLDHALIIEKDSLKPATIAALKDENFRIIEVDFRPTAERFAAYFYEKLAEKGYDVNEVTVYETPNNCAVYSR